MTIEDRFLDQVSGVIHVGANTGGERSIYGAHNIMVVWVEPIPSVFDKLRRNIRRYPNQSAYQYLLSDSDDNDVILNISNNKGLSSSIFQLAMHQDIWPTVKFVKKIRMKTKTLASMIEIEKIKIDHFQSLVLDTQGSELLILKGASPILNRFNFIKTEAADFESYKGACTSSEITEFLSRHSFHEIERKKFAEHPSRGSYFDIIFERK